MEQEDRSMSYYASPIRTNDHQENTYSRNVRRKLSSPNVTSAPATFSNLQQSPIQRSPIQRSPIQRSPIQRSPIQRSPSIGLSTPLTDAASLFHEVSTKKEGESDTGSLERNVSRLNIAVDNSKKYIRSTMVYEPNRKSDSMEYEHNSPQRHSPIQKKADEFAFKAPRINKRDLNAFSRYKQNQQELLLNPPREKDVICVNGRNYTIIKEIGRGASGKVYQVLCNEYNEIFALKWIEIKKPEDRQSIMEEIELLKSLDTNENIVSLLDHHISSHVIHMVMELGEMDLANLLHKQKKKAWNINFVRYYWDQMLKCVNAIHHSKIVHSDLKPANFVLVKGYLKLIDFGIAKRVADDSTKILRDTQVGTLNYMSPEALMDMNEGRTDAESLVRLGTPSDVWSLGCILYQMVYGQTPFYKLPVHQKIIHIPNRDFQIEFSPTIRSEVNNQIIQLPPMLIKLLEGCLDRTPALRPTLYELMTHPFVNNSC
ncbi:kinase-like domain-containing protein [Gilbertella persicaria]|nr:kinase-like domain-containing protein [Gilbertella persicaria]KAI8062351.1 kinase-like domain-containing protein [Gilbertella persicaria]